MTEQPESIPEETEIQRVARLAAEAATRTKPDHTARIEALETALAEILAALAAAAGPEGNAARLAGRLTAAEDAITALSQIADQLITKDS